MKQRLHKILAASTKLSRRAAEKAIEAGEVKVGGHLVKKLGTLADPFQETITWKGKKVRPPQEMIYIAYHKPKRRLVTKSDPEGRPTIWGDLRQYKDKINTVGRLDYDSEGLLLLTNDGELINRLTHPSHEVVKIYQVKIQGEPSRESIEQLRNGIRYHGINYAPAEVKIVSRADSNTWVEFRISEGKNRQLRNMVDAIGHRAQKLKRLSIGPIKLGALRPGEWRVLRRSEREALYKLVGLTPR